MSRQFLWEMRPYFRHTAGELVLGSVAGIVMNTAIVLPALLLGRAIDVALAVDRGEADASAVASAALAFVGGTLLTEVPRILKRWWLMTANARIRANVRADAMRGVLAWPMARLDRTPIGELMARIVADVDVLGIGVREFTVEIWDTVLFSISLFVAMLLIDFQLTVLVMLPVPLAMLLAHATGRWVGRRTTAAREANGRLTAALQEMLVGVRVLRLFGRAAAAIDRVRLLSRRLADANLATARLRGGLQPVYTSMMAGGIVVLIWQGGERVISGLMSLGAFVAYLDLFIRFAERGFRVPQLLNSMHSAGAAYERLRPLLAPPLPVQGEPPYASFDPWHVAATTPSKYSPRTMAEEGDRMSGPVPLTLRNVTFRYPEAAAPALVDISLDIQPGALVAVTGPVGSGKSALARTLLGLYPLEAGCVQFDGHPLDEVLATVRAARTGYLPQDGYLFSGTIRENILLFEDSPGDLEHASAASSDPPAELLLAALASVPTNGHIVQATTIAALDGDLIHFPVGLDTEIGDRGIRVSGGQRQRIGLARALAAPQSPGLLVLDDPFSAVDVDTEARIMAGLLGAFGPSATAESRATIVYCSHRLALFPSADLVVVLDGGRVVEQGTHAELMAAAGLYARMYRAQLLAAHGADVDRSVPSIEVAR